MTLPHAAAERQLQHRRQIDVQVFSRGNGLWEVDAVLTDTRTRDVTMSDGVRPAGTPIHDMLLRLVVNEQFDIVEAGSDTRWMPYTGVCQNHGDAYTRLVGLNLLQNFRLAMRERVGGVLGCTHITELAQVLPTAVVQAFAGNVIDTRGLEPNARRPFQIDRCHALRADGDVVRRIYPRWYRPSQRMLAEAAAGGAATASQGLSADASAAVAGTSPTDATGAPEATEATEATGSTSAAVAAGATAATGTARLAALRAAE